jgi:excisionase family DNA binding protein
MTEPTSEKAAQALTMTIAEVAAKLGIGRATAYAGARTGAIPVIRINRRLLVPRAAFQRMLEAADRT